MSHCVDATIIVKEKTFLQIKDHPLVADCGEITTYPNFTKDGETVVRIDWKWINHWLDCERNNGKQLIATVKKLAKNDGFAVAWVDEYDASFSQTVGDDFEGFLRVKKVVHVEDDWNYIKKEQGYVPSGQLGAA